jgi:hypothetical protein
MKTKQLIKNQELLDLGISPCISKFIKQYAIISGETMFHIGQRLNELSHKRDNIQIVLAQVVPGGDIHILYSYDKLIPIK